MARGKAVNTAVETIRTNMEKERPKNHPIKEHPLSECDEYIRKLYIDTLCVIAQYETEDAEKSLNFVRRVHTGAGLTNDFTEHIKNAMEITVEMFEEFIAQCRENKLENIFFVDGLIAACADGTPNSKQVDFISEITDALRISKRNVNHLSELAASILEQSDEKYHAACDKIETENRWALVKNIVCYVKEFVSGVIVDTDELLWIYSKKPTTFLIDELFRPFENVETSFGGCRVEITLERKEIILENLIIKNHEIVINDESEKFKRIIMSNCESVSCLNCFFDIELAFPHVSTVKIDNCHFDFENAEITQVFNLVHTVHFNLSNSKISNITIYNGESSGIFRLCSENINMDLHNCTFFNITRSHCDKEYWNMLVSYMNRSSSYCAETFNMDNCSFELCKDAYSNSYLFPSQNVYKRGKNNTFSGCSKPFYL